ncbi:MAG TPA: hypothetical protein VFA04_21830 [Bryobacteraceae bacterium]|nr:hypothetical protein [Bryobacteraceae bacterium]
MKNHLITLIPALVAIAATALPVHGQSMPNFGAGINAMVRNQIMMQKQGDAMARAAAMRYYRYALALRRMGYKGDIPTGVTTESLNAANSALQNAGANYVRNSQINMQKTWNSIDDTNAAITRGCQTTPNPALNIRVRVCP